MSSFRILIISVCVLGLAAGAVAQDKEAPQKPEAESFIKYIPAGTMGFVATNNLDTTIKHVEKFLADIGADELMGMDLEESPGALLGMLRISAKLGDGFNSNGGVIMIMLDPEQFEIDLPQAVEDDTMPEKLPYVVFVAGSSVEEVFGAYEPVKNGDYTKLTLPIGEMMAAQCGDYVLISPMKEALKAVLEAKTKATDKELSKKQIELFEKSDISIYVNMRIAGPILNGMAKAYEKTLKKREENGEFVTSQQTMIVKIAAVYREFLSQLDALCITGQIADDGVVLDAICDWTPDSDIGKAVAAFKSPNTQLLNCVPDFSYIIAMGAAGQSDISTMDIQKTLQSFADNAKLEEEQVDRMEELSKAWNEQATGMQVVIGQGIPDSNLIGVTWVINCKDAGETKKLLAETAAFYGEILQYLTANDSLSGLEISYEEGVESLGEMQIDAINVTHPKLVDMKEDELKLVTTLLGEDKIRFLVASPDNNTIVVTLGGAQAYLEKALETVKHGTGSVQANEDVKKAMAHMPKNACFIFMGNAGNLFSTISSGMTAIAGESNIPFEITCQEPLAIGVSVEGASTHMVIFAPTTLVKECIDAYKTVSQPHEQPPDNNGEDGGPLDEGEDF